MHVETVKLHSVYKTAVNTAKRIKPKVSKPTVQTALMSSVAASAIAAAALAKPKTVKEITTNEIEKKLVQKGFIKNDEDNYVIKKLSDEQKERINKRYGENNARHLFWGYENNEIEPSDLKKFKDFIDIDKKLGSDMFNNHFDNLLDTYLILKTQNRFCNINNQFNDNPDKYKIVYNIIKTDFDDGLIENLGKWKGQSNVGDAGTAQTYLREGPEKFGIELPESTQKYLDKMTKLIDTQPLPETTKLYRREGMEVLKDVKLQDGTHINLAQMMKDIAGEKHPEEKLNKLKELILDNEITATQPGFMATSLDKELMATFKGPDGPDGGYANVIWTFDVAPNTKGFYIEPVNSSLCLSTEQEVLLQKGSKMVIEDIDYNKYHDKWAIKAKVSN